MNIYVGEVDERGKFKPDDPQAFTEWFMRRKGRRVSLTPKDFRARRTNPQNRYWWGVVVRLFSAEDAMNCTPEEAHEALKFEVNAIIRVVGDRVIRIPQSTADLNTAEFKQMWARAQQLGAELYGLNIPDPFTEEADAMVDEKLVA